MKRKSDLAKRSRRFRRRMRMKRPVNVAASVLTTIALYCGIASIFESINGDLEWAAYYIIAAMIFDALDGTVARITRSVSEFGKELDSLSDVVSFGVAPAVLLYMGYLSGWNEPNGSLLAIVYVILGALRLARYNVFQAERQDLFIGLPIPGAAGTIASFSLFVQYFEMAVADWLLVVMTVTLGLLMVSTIRYPKQALRVFTLAPRKAFQFLVIVAVGIAIFHYANEYSPSIVLFPLAIAYVLFGVVNETYSVLRRRRIPLEREAESQPVERRPHPESEAPSPK